MTLDEGRLSEAPADLLVLTDAAGVIRYASPRRGGLLDGEPRGARLLDVLAIHPAEREAVRAMLSALASGGGVRRAVEVRARDVSGSWRVVTLSGESLLDDPEVGRVVLHLTDVTARADLEEQVRRSQRMQAVGRLAGGIAHDFRNVLTVIRASADLAREAVPPGSPALADLTEISDAADRAAALTEKLLAFGRRDAARLGPCDLNRVVGDLRPLLSRLLGEDLRTDLELEPGLPPVAADPTQLDQVLLNLAINARQAMPDGGRLVLRTARVRVGGPDGHAVLGLGPGEYATLEVEDDGPGMGPETLSHVFEPFFTTRGEDGGTGLGLATVYGIVTGSGGQIHVWSELGRGTLFRAYLPLAGV